LRLKRLELTNFRNYARQVIEPGVNLNIFTGRNAQGKTNILESIYFAFIGRSFRTPREREIIKLKNDFSRIDCLFETKRRQIEVKILLRPGRKTIEVNCAPVRGYPLGWPGVVLFTPDDLMMIKGAPQERRRFLDLEIGPFHPRYGHYLGRFNRVLIQRNNLLREIREKKLKSDSLQAWNEQFCRYGAVLLSMRLELLKKFSPASRALHRELTGGEEDLGIRYLSTVKIEEPLCDEEIYLRFKEEISRMEGEEIARAQSLIGPHRDDLAIFINGSDARIYGSRGQQRTIALTLKIAQIRQWKEEMDEHPVLLLDDVLYDLDGGRRRALFNKAGDEVQIFLTATGEEELASVVDCNKKIFTVAGGELFD